MACIGVEPGLGLQFLPTPPGLHAASQPSPRVGREGQAPSQQDGKHRPAPSLPMSCPSCWALQLHSYHWPSSWPCGGGGGGGIWSTQLSFPNPHGPCLQGAVPFSLGVVQVGHPQMLGFGLWYGLSIGIFKNAPSGSRRCPLLFFLFFF